MHPPIVSWHSWHSAMVPTPNTVFYADSRSLAPVPLGRLDRGQGCVGDRCHAASAGAGFAQHHLAGPCLDDQGRLSA